MINSLEPTLISLLISSKKIVKTSYFSTYLKYFSLILKSCRINHYRPILMHLFVIRFRFADAKEVNLTPIVPINRVQVAVSDNSKRKGYYRVARDNPQIETSVSGAEAYTR